MKKLFALLLSALLVLSACGETAPKEEPKKKETPKVEEKKEEKPAEEKAEEPAKAEEKKEEPKEAEKDDKTIKLGEKIEFKDFDITIKSFAKVKDSDGKPALKYVYDFTNRKDDKTMPFMDFSLKGFQDGIEVDDWFFVIEGVDLGIGQKKIKSGVTLENAEDVIAIPDESKPLELELSESFSFDDTVYTITVDPKTLK